MREHMEMWDPIQLITLYYSSISNLFLSVDYYYYYYYRIKSIFPNYPHCSTLILPHATVTKLKLVGQTDINICQIKNRQVGIVTTVGLLLPPLWDMPGMVGGSGLICIDRETGGGFLVSTF